MRRLARPKRESVQRAPSRLPFANPKSCTLTDGPNHGLVSTANGDHVMRYTPPGQNDSLVTVEARYDNFIGGKWIAPTAGRYFANVAPSTGAEFTQMARSDASDIELALDAAHTAAPAWGPRAPPSGRTC